MTAALLHAHLDGTLVGVWTSPADRVYAAGEAEMADRGEQLVARYTGTDWRQVCDILANRSPYTEIWAQAQVADGASAAQLAEGYGIR